MKLRHKIFSCPPYISTPWKNVLALQMEHRPFGPVLIVELKSGGRVEIPNLDGPTMEKIFTIHAEVLGEEEIDKEVLPTFAFTIPLIERPFPMLQHNPEQASAPSLPPEVLEEMKSMVQKWLQKDLFPSSSSEGVKAEPHCNCPYCQIIRSISPSEESPSVSQEEAVSDTDLQFRSWNVEQKDPNLFAVTHPFDKEEHYTVFLGEPMGCTCGQNHCEHMEAVLRS